jgi:hypothetical protein
MTQEQQKKWELLEKFNYEAITAYMNAVGWQYLNKDVDVYDVSEKARYTLDRAIELARANPNEEQSVAVGGFHADVEFDGGQYWSMSLTFRHKHFA